MDEELEEQYGPDAVISRIGMFNLIHLDHPTEQEIQRRIETFDPEKLFKSDCQLCQMLQATGGDIVYDEASSLDEATPEDWEREMSE